MKRRDFLAAVPAQEIPRPAPRPMPRYKRPKAGVVLSGLSPYTGPFSTVQAAHLLRRTTFGMSRATVAQFAAMSLDTAVSTLLADQPAPAPPVNPTTGTTWIGLPRNSSQEGNYYRYLQAWWIGLMVGQSPSIIEKMTLFWHNFLAANYATVGDSRYMYTHRAVPTVRNGGYQSPD